MAYVDILDGDSAAGILAKLNTGLGAADTAVQPDDAVDTLAETSTAKILTGDERTKLTGVAAGATANSADATLLDRANHTGTQALNTLAVSAPAAGELSVPGLVNGESVLSSKVIFSGFTKIVTLSDAEYAALSPPDSFTLYFTTG